MTTQNVCVVLVHVYIRGMLRILLLLLLSTTYSRMNVEDVLAKARQAKEGGSTRFCMGAAWREGGGDWAFKQVS